MWALGRSSSVRLIGKCVRDSAAGTFAAPNQIAIRRGAASKAKASASKAKSVKGNVKGSGENPQVVKADTDLKKEVKKTQAKNGGGQAKKVEKPSVAKAEEKPKEVQKKQAKSGSGQAKKVEKPSEAKAEGKPKQEQKSSDAAATDGQKGTVSAKPQQQKAGKEVKLSRKSSAEKQSTEIKKTRPVDSNEAITTNEKVAKEGSAAPGGQKKEPADLSPKEVGSTAKGKSPGQESGQKAKSSSKAVSTKKASTAGGGTKKQAVNASKVEATTSSSSLSGESSENKETDGASNAELGMSSDSIPSEKDQAGSSPDLSEKHDGKVKDSTQSEAGKGFTETDAPEEDSSGKKSDTVRGIPISEQTSDRAVSQNALIRKVRKRNAQKIFFMDERTRVGVLPEMSLARKELRDQRYRNLDESVEDVRASVTREMDYLSRIVQITANVRDRTVDAEVQDRLAESYYFSGRFEDELKARMETVKLLKLEGEPVLDYVIALNSLAMTYLRAGLFDSVGEVIEEAAWACAQITPDQNDPRIMQLRHYEITRLTSLNIGIYDIVTGNLESAVEKFMSIAQYTAQGDFETDIFCAAHYFLSKISLMQGSLEGCFSHYFTICARMHGRTAMHEIASVICGMLAVEISNPLIRMNLLPLAEDFLHTGRSIVMMEESPFENARRLSAIVGLGKIYYQRRNLMAAEGFFRRVHEELTNLPGTQRAPGFAVKDTDVGFFSSQTYAGLWSSLLPIYADYLSDTSLHERTRSGEAARMMEKGEKLQAKFMVLQKRAEKKATSYLPPLWYFDAMLPRYQLAGLTASTAATESARRSA